MWSPEIPRLGGALIRHNLPALNFRANASNLVVYPPVFSDQVTRNGLVTALYLFPEKKDQVEVPLL